MDKTAEEIFPFSDYADSRVSYEDIIKRMKDYAAQAGWTKVEDDMPDYDQYVLWHTEGGHLFVEALDKDGNDWLYEHEVEGFKMDKVTHWMPLPKSPKNSKQ